MDLAEIGYKVDTGALLAGERALDKFGAANKKMAVDATNATAGTKALTKTIEMLEHQAHTFAAAGGRVGAILTAMGPAGLAAAASIGVLTLGLGWALSQAEKFGQKAIELRTFANTTGLTIDQIRALKRAAAETGISGDALDTWVQRFTISLDEARKGTGPLADALLKIDQELLLSVERSKTTGEAFNVLAEASTRAGLALNKMLRESLGRGSAEAGPVLAMIQQVGGLDALVEKMKQYNKGSEDQIRNWAKLTIETQNAQKQMENAMGKLFTDQMLQGQRDFYVGLTKIASGVDVMRQKFMDLESQAGDWVRYLFGQKIPAGENSKFLGTPGQAPPPPPAPPPEVKTESAEARYNNMKRWMDVLAGAATATEQLKLKNMELEVSQEKLGKVVASDELINRVRTYNQLQSESGLSSQRIGFLGDLASALEVEAQKRREVNLAMMTGVQLSKQEVALILQRAKLTAEYAQLPNQLAFERSQLGRNDTEAAVAQKLRSSNLPVDLNSATAEMIRFNEQLKLSKDLTTDVLSTFAHDFRNEIMRGASAWQALQKSAVNALNKIADKLIDIAIQNLVAKAFGPAGMGMNAVSSLFGPANLGPTAAGGGLPAIYHMGGTVGQPGAGGRSGVNMAAFMGAPRYHSGIDYVGGERPAILKVGERVTRAEDNRASMPHVNVQVINQNGSSVEVGEASQNDQGGIDFRVMIKNEVSSQLGSGKHDSAMGRYGVKGRLPKR